MAHDFATRRHPIEQGEDQPTEGIHILAPLRIQQLDAKPVLQLLDFDDAQIAEAPKVSFS